MPSSTPDEHANPEEPQSEAVFLARMREGVRGSVDRIRGALTRATYPTLTALLCSSACAPIIAASLGAGVTLTAAFGTLGAIGGNAISELINTRLSRTGSDGSSPDLAEIDATLTELFTEVLQSDSPELAEARAGVAELLRRSDAFEVVIREALREGHRDLLDALMTEIEALASANEETRVLLVEQRDLLLELCRDQGQTLEIQLATREEVREILGVLVQMFQFVQGLAAGAATAIDGARWEGSPYRGLQPFTAKDAPIFFGRTVTLAELVTKASACIAGGTMIVTGPSGVGKSSLLRAGLLPAVEHGLLREDPDQGAWRAILLEKPGDDPLKSLAEELAKHGGRDSGDTLRSLNAHPEEAGDRFEERRTGPDGERPERMLLVVDQFEEVFTLADEQRRATFLEALASIARNPKAFVVLGIRSDFVDRCMSEPSLRGTAQDRLFRVGPMTRDQMRQAAALPAAAVGIRVEERVLDTLLDELFGSGSAPRTPGAALPLMSQTMLLLWEEGHGDRRLTYSEYVAVGGVENAVTTAAERAYSSLGPEGQSEAERFFRRLVGVKSDGSLVRLSLNRSELDGPQLPIFEAFLAERLLVADEATVEISHDVLLEQWTRLREWLEPDLDSRILLTQLETDAAEWSQKDRDASFLYQGARLEAVESGGVKVWEARPDPSLSPSADAAAFLALSRERQARRIRLRRILTGNLAGIAALALILSVVAFVQNQDLTAQRNRALSQQLAAQSAELRGIDGALAQLLAAAAWRLDETDEAFTALAESIGDPSAGNPAKDRIGATNHLEYSPDGNFLATTAYDGVVALWSTDTWTFEALTTGDSLAGNTWDLEFSPDGSRLATATGEGVILWDLNTLRPETTLESGDVGSFAFSPDGSMLALAQSDRTGVWDLRTSKEVARLAQASTAVAFSGDGSKLVIGAYDAEFNGMVQQWDLASRELLTEHSTGDTPPPDMIRAVSADPGMMLACSLMACFTLDNDGSFATWAGSSGENFVTISDDGGLVVESGFVDVTVWDSSTGNPVKRFPTTGSYTSMALQPGSSILAAGTGSGLQLWDLDRASVQSSVLTSWDRGTAPTETAFSRDADRMLGYGFDDTTVVDFHETAEDSAALVGDFSDLYLRQGAINSDGSKIAGIVDGGAFPEDFRIRDLETGETSAPFTGMEGQVAHFAFSPVEDLLAVAVTATDSGEAAPELWLWDLGSHALRARVTEIGAVSSLSFSPDGASLATADGIGAVKIWDTDDGFLDMTLEGIVGVPSDLEFSTDGARLGVATATGLSVWDLGSGVRQQFTTGVLTGNFSFSPDDRYVAYFGDSGMRFWSLERDQLAMDLEVGQESGGDGRFVPGTWEIITVSIDDVRRHDVSFLAEPYAAACQQAGRDLTEEEWSTYLRGFAFEEFEVCPS